MLKSLIPDIRDVLIFLGLGALGVGLWMFKPWVSLVVVGVILLVIGLVTSLRGK